MQANPVAFAHNLSHLASWPIGMEQRSHICLCNQGPEVLGSHTSGSQRCVFQWVGSAD